MHYIHNVLESLTETSKIARQGIMDDDRPYTLGEAVPHPLDTRVA